MRTSRLVTKWKDNGSQAYHKRLMAWLGCALLVAGGQAIAEIPLEQAENRLSPFSSDGCSLFPDGTRTDNMLWQSCCISHDLAYWQGGDYKARIAADNELASCVQALGEPVVAVVMLLGVRFGGSPFWPTDFRWGYGWSHWRGYSPLTLKEKSLVVKMLEMPP
jgi:hypothetical protein